MLSRVWIFLLLFVTSTFTEGVDFQTSLEGIRNQFNLPAIAAMISTSNGIKSIAATGKRKLGFIEEVTIDDKFHLGSCTKAMTSTLAATFIEEKKLEWSSTLKNLFPEISIHKSLENVKFEDLLVHRAGLSANPGPDFYNRLSSLDISEARRELAKSFLLIKPEFKVGTYHYSNVGYIIAGHILERISGKSWEVLMEDRLFSPLGMNCGFGITSSNEEKIPTQPWGHLRGNNSIVPLQGDNAPFYGPAGTVHCPMKDWNKFLSIHIDGYNGIESIIKVSSFKKLHTPYPEEGETYTYGAWRRLDRKWAKGHVFTHTGSNTLNYSNVWIAPKIKTSIIGVSNIGGDNAWKATNAAVLEALEKLK